MAISLKAIVGRLNNTTRTAVEGAAGLCLSRTHYDVEIEHYLMKLLDTSDSDFASIVKQFGVDKARLSAELGRSLDKLKTGNARTPAFSPSLVRMLTEAWTMGSLEFNGTQVRTGFTILALVSDEELSRILRDISREFQKVEPEALRKQMPAILEDSMEQTAAPASASPAGGGAPGTGKMGGKTPNLDQYTVNLTENARKGKLDAVLGRDFEIRQIVDILTRRRQNNPILTGEAGVGKTAVVEGFAMRIVAGDVPPVLRNVTLRTLDLALLQAGAGIKGEFENRLKGLIEEVKSSPIPIILFIDEAHTMIGAGGTAGQGDAANLLKPALARGELRTIAATTWSEYKKYFEKDPALARRFQVVKVEEPDEVKCNVMLRGVVPMLEKHHSVRILDEGLTAAVKFSHRYLPDRQLPDKAVSVLDTACARLSLGQNATPSAVEDVTREVDDCAVQIRVLEREAALGTDHSERLAAVNKTKAAAEARLAELQARWDKERDLVAKIRDIRVKLEELVRPADAAVPVAQAAAAAPAGAEVVQEAPAPPPSPDALRADLATLNAELEQLQGENPLMGICVDAQIVGEVVSGWTGIPIGKMLKDEVAAILQLESHLGKRVIGQDHALGMISERVRTSKASLEDPSKPIGVFMLVGPSGVGKTETALALADLLYGGERNLITINMSEFQESHTVSTLKGSPPGYVGYGEGGVLTEAVRRRPYSVVLLDEVEKAHPDVLELFFQVFDKGKMEDGEGREIDFKNTIIILTSNAGTDTLMKLTADPETAPSSEGLVKALKPELNKIFKPAFLGRMVIIPYFPIRDEALKLIVRLKLGKIQRRLMETHKIPLTHDEALIEEVAKRCTEVESGARNVDNILTNTLLPEISRQILGRMAERRKLDPIHVTIGESGEFVYN
ncbi:MAG TPA: type VI secretion system ATPase TssH [Candidatus Sulfopaludibacter sp.]|jgi:type VI secretion system protein VasG|nr:type VI secretion system ATPase TssH [Candidatus Sulfopaludibacter sp.]